MNRRMLEVMQRRGELLAKISAQREWVAATAERWEIPLQAADKGIAVMRFLRANPLLVAAAAGVLLIRRRGVVGALSSGWRLWRWYRQATAFTARVSAQLRPE